MTKATENTRKNNMKKLTIHETRNAIKCLRTIEIISFGISAFIGINLLCHWLPLNVNFVFLSMAGLVLIFLSAWMEEVLKHTIK